MTYKKVFEIPSDHKLVIQLPDTFPENHKVLISVDEINSDNSKMSLMKEAVNDPVYLVDLNEVNNDFEALEHETL